MSDIPKIIDLENVVEPYLDGGKMLSYTTCYLTKAGDNYGSIILSVMAKIQMENGEIKDLPLVAKLPPITNDIFWKIFQPERTCLTENAVYKYISPYIREIQLAAGLSESNLFDGFPKYYGSRISLNENATQVDRNAVLVQENLLMAGFKAGNRFKLFDLIHTELIMREMAKFHALCMALRLKKPEEYARNIWPYMRHLNMNNGLDEQGQRQLEMDLYECVTLATNNNDRYVDRIKEIFQLYDKYMRSDDVPDSLYTTIAHCDLWINNLLVKYDDNGLPKTVKFVDFQISQYESLAHDVVFFLLSSVETIVMENNFNQLLHLYYESFIDCLKSVNISTNQYTFNSFLDEIYRQAPLEIIHTLFMIKILLADHSTMPDDYKNIDISVLSKNVSNRNVIQRTMEVLHLAEKYNFFWGK